MCARASTGYTAGLLQGNWTLRPPRAFHLRSEFSVARSVLCRSLRSVSPLQLNFCLAVVTETEVRIRTVNPSAAVFYQSRTCHSDWVKSDGG